MAERALPDLRARLQLDTSDLTAAASRARSVGRDIASGLSAAEAPLNRIPTASRNVTKSMDEMGGSFGRVSFGMSDMIRSSLSFSLAYSAVNTVTNAVSTALSSTISSGIAFQDQMNTLRAVSGATAVQMQQLSQRSIDLGNDLSLPSTSAADAADAMVELAKAGLSVNDTMAAAKGTLQLAAAAGINTAEAATYTATALNAFHLQGSQAVQVADLLAASANASAAEIGDVGLAMQQSAAVFSAAHIPIQDLVAAIGEMANAGIRGSDAGTSLKQMLLQLEGATGPAKKQMQDLGIAVYDSHGKMLPFRDIIAEIHDKTANLTQAQRDQAFVTIFGSDATRAANVIFGQGVQVFDDMEKAVTKQGAAAEVAAAKSQGLGGALRGIQSQVETLQLQLFQQMAPALEAVVRGLSDMIGQLQSGAPATGQMAGAVATLRVAMGGIQVALSGARAEFVALWPTIVQIAAFFQTELQPSLQILASHTNELKLVFEALAIVVALVAIGLAQAVVGFAQLVAVIVQVVAVLDNLTNRVQTALTPALEGLGNILHAANLEAQSGYPWWVILEDALQATGVASDQLDAIFGALNPVLQTLADTVQRAGNILHAANLEAQAGYPWWVILEDAIQETGIASEQLDTAFGILNPILETTAAGVERLGNILHAANLEAQAGYPWWVILEDALQETGVASDQLDAIFGVLNPIIETLASALERATNIVRAANLEVQAGYSWWVILEDALQATGVASEQLDAAFGVLNPAIEAVGAAVAAAGQEISRLPGQLVAAYNATTAWIGTMVAAFAAFGAQVLAGIGQGMALVVTSIQNSLSLLSQMYLTIFAIWLGFWITVFGAILTAIGPPLQAIASFIGGVLTTIASFVSGVLNQVYGFFVSVLTAVYGFVAANFTAVWNVVSQITTAIFTTVAAFLTNLYNEFVAVLNAAYAFIVANLNATFVFIQSLWNAVSSFMAAILSVIWNTITFWFDQILGTVNTKQQQTQGVIQQAWNFLAGWIGGPLSSLWSQAADWFNRIYNTTTTVMSSMQRAIQGIWDGIVGAGAKFGADLQGVIWGGVHGVVDILNRFIGSANTALKPLLGHDLVAPLNVSGLASGGVINRGIGEGFVTGQPTVIVGEGNGPEYVIPTEPRYRGNALKLLGQAAAALGMPGVQFGAATANDSGGTVSALSSLIGSVAGQCVVAVEQWTGHYFPVQMASQMSRFVNSASAAIGSIFVSMIPPFGHTGIVLPGGMAIDSNWGLDERVKVHPLRDVPNIAGYITGYPPVHLPGGLAGLAQLGASALAGLVGGIIDPSAIIHGIIDPIAGVAHGAANALPNGFPHDLGNAVINQVVDAVINMAAGALGVSGGAATAGGNLGQWISQAIALTGVPSSWAGPLNTLIQRESGGNPHAVNRTDINAILGHPSQGLAQVIPSTFAAYHQAGTSGNILDPIANIAAAINYIKARYGTIFNVQQANAALPPKGYAQGGSVVPHRVYMVGENGPELFVSNQAGEIMANGGRGGGSAGPGRLEKLMARAVEVLEHIDGTPGLNARQASMRYAS